MKKYKIFLNEHIIPSALEKLQDYADITNELTEIENIDAIIIRTTEVSREMIEKAKNLKVIGKHGIGYDSIDIKASKENGVKVVYTPKANVQSVAELIVGLMISVSRNIALAREKNKKNENITIAPKDLVGMELSGKTLGLVGAGNIGLTTSNILKQGFNMNVIAYDPFIDDSLCKEYGIHKVDKLEDVMSKADYITISVPLNDGTRYIIDENMLKLCKSHAVIINTSRGGVVDEKALYQALVNDKIFGAASDVFEVEPPTSENPLINLDNFVSTPHIGAATEEALERMGETVVDEVLKVLEGKEPKFRVV